MVGKFSKQSFNLKTPKNRGLRQLDPGKWPNLTLNPNFRSAVQNFVVTCTRKISAVDSSIIWK